MAIDLTPAKLAELKQKASECDCKIWRIYHRSEGYSIRAERNIKIADSGYLEDAQFIAAADPATVLAMVEEIEFLRRDNMVKAELLGKAMLKARESEATQ